MFLLLLVGIVTISFKDLGEIHSALVNIEIVKLIF